MHTDHTLADWRLWQEAQALSQRTITERQHIVAALLRHSGAHPLKLKSREIIAFCAREHLSASSKATYYTAIRAYCVWLVRTKRRKDDPSVDAPRPKSPKRTPRPISTEQLERVVEATRRRRARMMVLLAAYAGLRVHEIAQIRGEYIDLDRRTILTLGKGNKLAETALHPLIAAEALNFPRRGYLFPAYKNRHGSNLDHVTKAAVYYVIKGAMERADVEATPHQIRHWYATMLLAGGVDVRIVQEMMRHETLATTEIYTLVDISQQQDAVLVLPDVTAQAPLPLAA